MKVFRIGEIMSKCNSSFKTTAKKAKKPMKVKIEKPKPAENVFALNADREVREKMQAGWRLRVVRSGKLESAARDEGSLFLDESRIEGMREMVNGRIIGMSSRVTQGKEYADIWTLIPPKEAK